MTATAALPRSGPARAAVPSGAPVRPAPPARSVAYQRVVHQLVRRELRLLAELSTWAPPGEPARTAVLTGHADLVGRVLLHHHRVERELLWPALRQALPGSAELDAHLAGWTASCARIDFGLRDLGTAARQWAVAGTRPARDRFAMACLDLADAVDAQTAHEEQLLHPLLADFLDAADWVRIARSARAGLSGHERSLVLGLALEDACAGDRARLLSGLPATRRWAWRVVGARRYRGAVVRLRGAPPAL
jgi:hemerythrin HHE cation binding domain-containing protein